MFSNTVSYLFKHHGIGYIGIGLLLILLIMAICGLGYEFWTMGEKKIPAVMVWLGVLGLVLILISFI